MAGRTALCHDLLLQVTDVTAATQYQRPLALTPLAVMAGHLTRLSGLGQFWIAHPLPINGLAGKVFTTAGDWEAGRLRCVVEAEAAN